MPFTPETKNSGDLIKSTDWNESMSAIVELFSKFHTTSGHQHTGTEENAPPIKSAGIADNAISESKIAKDAVTEVKIDNGAVTSNKIKDQAVISSKIAKDAVTEVKIANGAVTEAKIDNGAVTSSKIKDQAVISSKIAPGVLPPDIGVTVTIALSDGQNIPIPSGFVQSECLFFAYLKNFTSSGSEDRSFNVFADENGRVNIAPQENTIATGVALAKKGGW